MDDEVVVSLSSVELESQGAPSWQWMWMFSSNTDKRWALNNFDVISECGFQIFEDEHNG